VAVTAFFAECVRHWTCFNVSADRVPGLDMVTTAATPHEFTPQEVRNPWRADSRIEQVDRWEGAISSCTDRSHLIPANPGNRVDLFPRASLAQGRSHRRAALASAEPSMRLEAQMAARGGSRAEL
jgi:hypothetical protein